MIDQFYADSIQQQFGNKYMKPLLIGEGAFSKVFKCQNELGEFVAIKVVNLLGIQPFIVSSLKNEIQLLNQIKNDNVIRLYESQESQSALFLVLEYCEMDVKHMMINYFDNKLPEDLVINILRQMVNGLNYLHQKNILHRDLKLENIGVMIKKEDFYQHKKLNNIHFQSIFQNGSYKLLDLGLSKKFLNQKNTKTLAGTLLNMAPEILQRKSYSFEADIYSLGVCLYQMITGEYPFDNSLNRKKQIKLIQKQNAKFQEIQNSNLRDIIQKMLNFKVEDRLTFEQLYQSPLLQSTIENVQSQFQNSLIQNTEFSILDDVKSIQSDVSIICPNTSMVETDVSFIQPNYMQNQSNYEKISDNQDISSEINSNQSFEEIQKNSFYKSLIDKPKLIFYKDCKFNQLIKRFNSLYDQFALVIKLCENFLDLISSIPQKLKYQNFEVQFQKYLEYFSDLLEIMIKH
ncbi:unnamed protein product [Paramecium sonneborni]|uniref:Protein kinase domain-containing protein n=1 Tax=Paramecium sonneborni TaxID=65129 RepID=A0A8S1N6E4_9CILI|nr:unnamed protein product [Paramecium sonneborni]